VSSWGCLDTLTLFVNVLPSVKGLR